MDAKIGFYQANKPYRVLIYVNFFGGGNGEILFFVLPAKCVFSTFALQEKGLQ